MRFLLLLVGVFAAVVSAAQAGDGPATPAGILTAREGHGWRLATAEGMTLYIYDADEVGSGKSACDGECIKLRPPVVATDAAAPGPGWTQITRADGVKQWAFRGKPLYTYVRDAFAGATFGEGESWAVAFQTIPMPPGIAVSRTLLGQVLTTATGMTLYTAGPQAAASSDDTEDCTAECLKSWQPVTAPGLSGPVGEFAPVTRTDRIRQWTFRGKRLYTAVADTKPGDTNGQGAQGIWQSVVLEPAPPLPAWVNIVGSDGGALLADSNGHTLYAYDVDRNHLIYDRGEDCFGPCIEQYWAPVLAQADVAPLGAWSVFTTEDGVKQWAYQGKPLYISKRETEPGDLTGITLRQARAWRPIMRFIPSLQGASPNG
jgi:predicted lipoprotein with Yx(FWY)xxD motif